DLVPQREAGMTPYEIMLSESQERMLLVASPDHEGRVRQIFTRWGLDAVAIGRVTGDGKLRVSHGGKTVADIPTRALSEEAPVYQRPMRKPEYLDRVQRLEETALPRPYDWHQAVVRMMSSPNLCRKRWIWEQYDFMVRTNTVVGPGYDAAILRLKGK